MSAGWVSDFGRTPSGCMGRPAGVGLKSDTGTTGKQDV